MLPSRSTGRWVADVPIILASELARFAPHSSTRIADAVVTHADEVLSKWQITTARRLWVFLAMVSVESAGFSKLFEDMNYSAARLRQVWPSRFPTLAAAQPYAHNPEKLANYVYGGRLGNPPGTGYLTRGQGLLQLTGLTSFEKLAAALHVTVDQCRAMLTADDTMLDCAAATFSAWGLIAYADQHDVIGATLTLNGGLNGLADRQAAYHAAQQIWPSIRSVGTPIGPQTTVHAAGR